MKRLFRIFELAKNEQRVVLIIILILTTIAFVEYKRRFHQSALGTPLEMKSKPSPTAAETPGNQ